MSTEREAFKKMADENTRHRETVIKLTAEAINEFFNDHTEVAKLNTAIPMTVIFHPCEVSVDELVKLSKCLKALEENFKSLSQQSDVPNAIFSSTT